MFMPISCKGRLYKYKKREVFLALFKTKCAVWRKYSGSLGENGTRAHFLPSLEESL